MFDPSNLLALLLVPIAAYVIGAFILLCCEALGKQQKFQLRAVDTSIQDGH